MTIRYSVYDRVYKEGYIIEDICDGAATEGINKRTYETIADHRRRMYAFMRRIFVDFIHLEIQRTIDEAS